MGRRSITLFSILLALALCSCGGSGTASGGASSPYTISLALSTTTATIFDDGNAATVTLTPSATGGSLSSTLNYTVTGAPTGASYSLAAPGAATGQQTLTLTAGSATPGAYTLNVAVRDDAGHTASQSLSLTVGVMAAAGAATGASFQEAMSTSFQVASWNDALFTDYPTIPEMLTQLGSKHVRMQVMGSDIPETADGVWDFTTLDTTVQPILTATDQSPQFQIAYAPSYLYGGKTSGFVDSDFIAGYAEYAANLVRYYNKGGFTDAGGVTHVSSSSTPITYWGIYNEPNINGMTADEYIELYDATVPAMLAVDSSLKFRALDLSDWGTQEQLYAAPLIAQATAPIDVLATHFYSTCQQSSTDATLMATIPTFVTGVKYLKQQLAASANYQNTAVWVLENNVNADYSNNGMSACDSSIKFVTDARGSSSFFAAWRPYLFSQLGQAGAEALYHWSFAADPQYGEFNTSTGKKQLGFWVDYWLGKKFPADAAASVYAMTNNDSADVEILAVKRADGATVVLVSNHAVASATDNNGAGSARVVKLDLSALGGFSSATMLTLDASTDVVNGPTEQSIEYATPLTLNMSGYGSTILTLQ